MFEFNSFGSLHCECIQDVSYVNVYGERGIIHHPDGPDAGLAVEDKVDASVDDIVRALYDLRDSPLQFHFVDAKDKTVVNGLAYELIGYLVTFKNAKAPTPTTL